MGPVNQALWRSFHAYSAGSYSEILNSTVHPCNENRKLWFQPDPGHLLKNLKSGLLSNKTITLPDNFCKTHELPSAIVNCNHVKDIIECQEKCTLKIVPKLTEEDFSSGTYAKMKVNKSVNFLSRNTSGRRKLKNGVLCYGEIL